MLAFALMIAGSGSASGQDQDVGVPGFLLGDFVDDYGGSYTISEARWEHGTSSRYEIVEWSVEGQWLIARNHSSNPGEAGLWTRVDWLELDAASAFGWAYCYAVYDASTESEARSAPPSARETPRTGCNGFPFSRMRRPSSMF